MFVSSSSDRYVSDTVGLGTWRLSPVEHGAKTTRHATHPSDGWIPGLLHKANWTGLGGGSGLGFCQLHKQSGSGVCLWSLGSSSAVPCWTAGPLRDPDSLLELECRRQDSTHFPLVKTCLAFDIHNYSISTNKHVFNYSKCVIGHYVMSARRTFCLINIFWTIIPGSMLYYLIKKYCIH